MMQGLAVASGVVGAALPAVWSVVQPAVDPFSDEKDTPGEKFNLPCPGITNRIAGFEKWVLPCFNIGNARLRNLI